MSTFTPEHFQLLSPKRLDAAAETTEAAPSVSPDEKQKRAALARMARYEIVRRRGEVPVRDRYTSVDGE